MSLQERLKMRKVEKKDCRQFNELLRYVYQVTDHDLRIKGWEEREITLALEQANVLGWFDGEQLISQLSVYPFQVNIFGHVYEMGGLTGVGTYPEYSNQGLVNKLMLQALVDMRQRKQFISFLYPYSIPFYRRKGWEIISNKMTYEVKDYQLPKVKKVSGNVERVSINNQDIRRIYQVFSHRQNAAMIRNDLAWEEYWRWDLDNLTAGVYYDGSEQPQGYLLYWIAEEIFHIKEIVCINEEARIGLWNFISAHFSMLTKVMGSTYTDEPLAFLLGNGDIKETIEPHFMARIVDAQQFIGQYPFRETAAETHLTFTLYDPMLDWNQGIFTLHVTADGQGELIQGGVHPTASFDIQTLTTMLLGYKRPSYLAAIDRFTGDEQTVDILESLIERQTPYFSDYF
ncbi:GNAT family N-acetyltransferase [Peribacillus muralis]|uniref:GNAT family N-acetyltransferase n=1 Tax=Peribacillus muralis TaxID=264697 RepID=UPI001F4E0590|nr:GNAT family N-acetyltransferase [Peribacillus muralis]MCK1992936.1 GNAT family N-acetyltransferase [Peribacillus muralis]MCK2013491.1 GNAT family N-acetyltransferase [Peribacillus muralis]